MTITATINGLPCIALAVTLRTGPRASTGVAVMRPGDAARLPGGPLTVLLSDGHTSAEERSLHLTGISSGAAGTARR